MSIYKTIGVDEAGRGALAGPVVCAAVKLTKCVELSLLQDSKVMSAKRREVVYAHIMENTSYVGVAIVPPSIILRLNILHASMFGMKRAAERCLNRLDDLSGIEILVDGNRVPKWDGEVSIDCVVKGDSKISAISAASIVAKVIRDRVMRRYEDRYPGYALSRHKGYATKAHYHALHDLGPSLIHRKGFRLISALDCGDLN